MERRDQQEEQDADEDGAGLRHDADEPGDDQASHEMGRVELLASAQGLVSFHFRTIEAGLNPPARAGEWVNLESASGLAMPASDPRLEEGRQPGQERHGWRKGQPTQCIGDGTG